MHQYPADLIVREEDNPMQLYITIGITLVVYDVVSMKL